MALHQPPKMKAAFPFVYLLGYPFEMIENLDPHSQCSRSEMSESRQVDQEFLAVHSDAPRLPPDRCSQDPQDLSELSPEAQKDPSDLGLRSGHFLDSSLHPSELQTLQSSYSAQLRLLLGVLFQLAH